MLDKQHALGKAHCFEGQQTQVDDYSAPVSSMAESQTAQVSPVCIIAAPMPQQAMQPHLQDVCGNEAGEKVVQAEVSVAAP